MFNRDPRVTLVTLNGKVIIATALLHVLRGNFTIIKSYVQY